MLKLLGYLKTVVIRSINSIRKAKLPTMSTLILSSLSFFAYFRILLILVVAGFTYWLCYRPDYLSKKHYP
jgi:hypothetical protein